MAVEICEEVIEFVNRKNLADAGVVIKDGDVPVVFAGVEVAQRDFRPSDELGVAEDDGAFVPR